MQKEQRPTPVLVTGGAGYVGSFVCRQLKKSGFLPITIDNLCTGNKDHVKWGPFFKADLEKNKLREVFRIYKPVAVMHFAASAIVTESVLNPGKYYENNVLSTVNLLEVMKENHVKTIVFSSSCATYGEPKSIPISEAHPQHPISPYGKSKLMVEMILQDYQAFGIEHANLRYFNAAGACKHQELGELHKHETRLIPLLIQASMGVRKNVTIYGTDFPTKDGFAIRDYIHVEDLAKAHIKALLYLLQSKKSLSVNLGTGTGYSVKEIIQGIEKITKMPLPLVFAPRRKNEPSNLVCNPRKAESYLLFKPKYGLNEIIESAYLWQKKAHQLKAVL